MGPVLSEVFQQEATLKDFEDLIVGSGSDDFRAIEEMTSYFCPFEAIGMVRQEIRHAHFLTFLLDPNSSHGMQDALLKEFFMLASEQADGNSSFLEPLDIHFREFGDAIIYREKRDIDVLIEIPPQSRSDTSKGIVVAVELKVDASESQNQLEKYRSDIVSRYDDRDWDQAFVFLTPTGVDPSEKNQEAWVPVSLLTLVDRWESVWERSEIRNAAVDLFADYRRMLRREFLENKELETLAKRIWAKHRVALEKIYEYKPDLKSDVIKKIGEDWSEDQTILVASTSNPNSFTLISDEVASTPRNQKFVVKEWLDIPGLASGQSNWLASGSLVGIEITDWHNGAIRIKFVLGPGPAETRERIYEGVRAAVARNDFSIPRKTKQVGKSWKDLSGQDIVSKNDLESALDSEQEDIMEQIAEKSKQAALNFLKAHLPHYDRLLREALAE